MQHLTFYLDWIFCAQFAGLIWAQQNGLYRAAGLDVELMPWNDADDRSIVNKVLAGGICAGCAEDNLIVTAIDERRPVRVVGAMLQDTPLVLMSKPGRGIRSLADLRGKRIGIHHDGNRALQMLLALEGIAPAECDIQEVAFDLEHLRLDRFDALQGYTMTEPVQLASMGIATTELPLKHPQLLPYAQTYFASQSTIDAHRAELRAFLHASHDGWRAALAQPDEAAALLMATDAHPSTSDASAHLAEHRAMLARVAPLVTGSRSTAEIGRIDRAQWSANLSTYAVHGLTQHRLLVEDVVEDLIRPAR